MNRTILIIVGLACALLTAWGIFWIFEDKENIDRTAEEPNICEIILRDQMELEKKWVTGQTSAYFIQILGNDPSDEFLARFAGHQPPVKKSFQWSQHQGTLLKAYDLKWLSDKSVEIRGSYYRASLCAGGCTYLIIRKWGRWILKDTYNDWIS